MSCKYVVDFDSLIKYFAMFLIVNLPVVHELLYSLNNSRHACLSIIPPNQKKE